MIRVEPTSLGEGRKGLRFFCSGCKAYHTVMLKARNDEVVETYEWNGDEDKPTIVPTIKVADRCSLSIREGQIYYGYGCKHPLAGRVMPMASLVTMA